MHTNESLKHIRIGDVAIVKGGHPLAGHRLVVTRVDNHVYPICAGYARFKPDQLHFIGG